MRALAGARVSLLGCGATCDRDVGGANRQESQRHVLQPAGADVHAFVMAQAEDGQSRNRPQLLLSGQVASQLQDEEQSTLPPQAPLSQVTSQGPLPHTIPPPQALTPQSTWHEREEAQSTPPLHPFVPHVMEQGAVPHEMRDAQAFCPHSMLQLEDAPQSIVLRHAPSPQRTVQGPAPQRTAVGHALVPVHVMSQLDA